MFSDVRAVSQCLLLLKVPNGYMGWTMVYTDGLSLFIEEKPNISGTVKNYPVWSFQVKRSVVEDLTTWQCLVDREQKVQQHGLLSF